METQGNSRISTSTSTTDAGIITDHSIHSLVGYAKIMIVEDYADIMKEAGLAGNGYSSNCIRKR